jgi:prepilin-type N-terminal cleavage/methylation domain-containing protein
VREHGFTLMEMLLSITIIGLLAGLSVPVYESFVRRNDLDLTAQQLAASVRRASTYARSVRQDDAWGVRVQSSTVTLFKGTNFATRNTAFDETFSIPASVTPSGLTEVQFTKLHAAPTTTGNITLTSNTNSTKVITINAKATVDY